MIKAILGAPGQGMTLKQPGCKTAHDWAVQSLCIVVHHKPIKRAWAFQIESLDLGLGAIAPKGAPLAGNTGAIARSAHPVGNTGYTFPLNVGSPEAVSSLTSGKSNHG